MTALLGRMACLAAFALAPAASCQVFQIGAGTSTLYQAQGGSVTMHGEKNNASLGLGLVNGHLAGGGNWTRSERGSLYTAGSQTIPTDLPTDLFAPGHAVYALGGSIERKLAGMRVLAFAGATSSNTGTPFFQGERTVDPTGILLLQRTLAPALIATTEIIASRRTSALASLAWAPSRRWNLAAAGGIGGSQPYAALSLKASYPRIDLMASYLATGSQFRRGGDPAIAAAEPDRDNVQLTLRPVKSFTFTAGRQNFLLPAQGASPSIHTTVAEGSASLRLAGADLSASVFQSHSGDTAGQSRVLSASRSVGDRVRVTGSYLESRPSGTAPFAEFVANTDLTLTSRWTMNTVVNRSGGQTSVGFGGSFLANAATLSVDYETYYVPARIDRPFEQAVILNAQLYTSTGLGIHGATFVAPDGRLLYTADARGLVTRTPQLRDLAAHNAPGVMLLRGRVLDAAGHPIMGAALLIDQVPVFTGADGSFSMRERRVRTHTLTVLPTQFMDGGRYRIVSAPASIRSGSGDTVPETTVIVVPSTAERP